MFSLRRSARLRHRGTSRRRRPGGPGAGPGGGEKLRSKISRQPHHRQSGPRRYEKSRHGLRSAYFRRAAGGGRRSARSAHGRRLHRRAKSHRCPAGRQRCIAHGAGRPGGRYPDAVCPGGQRCRSNAGGGIDRLRRPGRGRTGGPSEKRDPSLPRPGLGTGAGGNRPAGLAGRDATGACKAGTGDRRGRWT